MSGEIDVFRDGLVVVEERVAQPDDELEAAAAEAARLEPGFRATGVVKAAGTCRICAAQRAVAVCVQCERDVCGEHAWTMLSICRECLPREHYEARPRAVAAHTPDLGIKWVEP